jgi:hypothetical protein
MCPAREGEGAQRAAIKEETGLVASKPLKIRHGVRVGDRTIDIKILENQMANAGFKQREQRALIAEALADTTPDDLRLYKWHIYNPNGQPNVAISRFHQPYEDTSQGIKETRHKEKQARKQAQKI